MAHMDQKHALQDLLAGGRIAPRLESGTFWGPLASCCFAADTSAAAFGQGHGREASWLQKDSI